MSKNFVLFVRRTYVGTPNLFRCFCVRRERIYITPIYVLLYSMRFYDFAKIQCLHYTGWSRGVDSFLENLLKAKILYTHWRCRETGEERPLVPQAPLSLAAIIISIWSVFSSRSFTFICSHTTIVYHIYVTHTHTRTPVIHTYIFYVWEIGDICCISKIIWQHINSQ